MRQRSLLFTGVLLTILFTLNGYTHADEEALEAAIEANYQKVKIINVSDASRCDYQSRCKYIKQFFCSDLITKAECDIASQKEAARVGADTFVFEVTDQIKNNVKDSWDKHYLYAYGLAYQCDGSLKSIGELNFAVNPLNADQRVQYVTKKTNEQCGTPKDCKFLRSYTCATSRTDPEKRCRRYIKKISKRQLPERFVIKKELRSEDRYHLLVDGYRCPLESVQ